MVTRYALNDTVFILMVFTEITQPPEKIIYTFSLLESLSIY